jgi:hypothetical protein
MLKFISKIIRMKRYFKTPITGLPKEFRTQIHDHIRMYSVTMLMAENEESDDVIPCSGTLCLLGPQAGIVTARHVWEEAKEHRCLLIMTNRGPLSIETVCLAPFVPEPTETIPDIDAAVPDIAFLKFDNSIKSKIEALNKVFYSVEKRIDQLSSYLDKHIGYWTVFGNPIALMRNKERKVSSFIYGTGIRNTIEMNGWDYVTIDLNIPENPDIPKEFSGVSGGGVWRTMWGFDPKQEIYFISNMSEDCSFSGVCFYQTAGDQSQLVAHGPISIYKKLFEFVNNQD